jgi:2-keto-3-deoxy-L-rhamnonate aldolase RhmA
MAAHLVRAGDAAGIGPLLRIPEVDAGFVKKVLNLGIQGIVLPHGTRKSAEALLRTVTGPNSAFRVDRLPTL